MSWSKEARIALVSTIAVGSVISAVLEAKAQGIKIREDVGITRTEPIQCNNRERTISIRVLLRFPWRDSTSYPNSVPGEDNNCYILTAPYKWGPRLDEKLSDFPKSGIVTPLVEATA